MQRHSAEICAIREHLDNLKEASWLGEARRWWPDYLFHCTAVQNVVSILTAGELLSRVRLNQTSHLKVDIAAPDIIAQTDVELMDHVRLYFRPRTPTQYNNEGFRPKGRWPYNSHCPVPIYLLFDAGKILSRADCRFTEGNVASGATPKSGIDELRQLPFESIYHDSWFEPPDRDQIVYRRNAEVLIPQRLGVESLRSIFCRTQAEYDTFMNLLNPDIRERWVSKIVVDPNYRLFHNQWTFVQQVDMGNQSILFRFNQDSRTPGPFHAKVVIEEMSSDVRGVYQWDNSEFNAEDELLINVANLAHPYDYDVELYLDDQLAFLGRYREDDLPF